MILVDSGVLIALSKLGRLELLQAIYGSAGMGPLVKKEVIDQGIAIGAGGIELLEKAVEDRWLQVLQPTADEQVLTLTLSTRRGLHRAESEALALAITRNLTLVIDDKGGRIQAGTLGVEYTGTAGVLFEAFVRELLTFSQLENSLIQLAEVTWLSPAVIMGILKDARRLMP